MNHHERYRLRKATVFLLPLLLLATACDAGRDPALRITAEGIFSDVSILSADSMEGRAPGTVGERRAIDHISNRFAQVGLQPVPGRDDFFLPIQLGGMTKGVWRWATRLVLLVSAVILLIAAGLGLLFPGYLRTESGTTLAIGLLMVPFMGLALVRASSLRGLGYTVQGQLPELAIKPLVFLALLLIFLLLSNGQLSTPHAMTLNIVATFAAFIVGALLLQRARPPGLANATPAYESRAWLATILPMASINAMHLINTQADILLIGIFMENADVGQYKVAAQISLVVAFGLQATKMIVEPHFARLYSQGNYSKLEKLARGASRFNITIALFVFSPLVLFGADLLHIAFGAAFVGAFLPMLILSAGRLAGTSLGTAGSILVMAGYHREYSRFWMIAVVLNVGLNLVLIPTLGLIGAAIATAFTLLIPYYLGWWGAKKWLGVDCFPFATRK